MENDSCLGYAIKTMQNLMYSDEAIADVIGEMRALFDEVTMNETAMLYKSSSY